jgi:hypothetical protein
MVGDPCEYMSHFTLMATLAVFSYIMATLAVFSYIMPTLAVFSYIMAICICLYNMGRKKNK